ncbi:unnamed protein product, partial [Nesidiocoris tenuis]
MRYRTGEDLAHRTLLLRPVRQTIRRGGLPREGRPAILPRRLLRHVRPQMRRMQPPHHGKLCFRPVDPMARRLLRMQ